MLGCVVSYCSTWSPLDPDPTVQERYMHMYVCSLILHAYSSCFLTQALRLLLTCPWERDRGAVNGIGRQFQCLWASRWAATVGTQQVTA